jgi:uncharacterized protein Usg
MRWMFWTLAFGALLGAAVFYSSQARAAVLQKPSICQQFDSAPTFATVNAIMTTLTGNGYGVDDAARVLVATVEKSCPQHLPLLQAYVDAGVFLYPELRR